MAYPKDLLSSGERIVVHRHPHVKMLIVPIIVAIITIGGGIWLALIAQDVAPPWALIWLITIGVVGFIVLVWLVLAPFVRWRTTHFVVTTDRVIAREGVIRRTGIDIPMSRINSVRFEHDLLDRIFGSGTLIIESASDQPLQFDDIPGVERIHTAIYREVNDNPYDDFGSAEEARDYIEGDQADEQHQRPGDRGR
ncbi:MAG: PH domain-containing protein [Haloechinothrix sp.]